MLRHLFVLRVVCCIFHLDAAPLLWKKLDGPLCLASRERQDWAKESQGLLCPSFPQASLLPLETCLVLFPCFEADNELLAQKLLTGKFLS